MVDNPAKHRKKRPRPRVDRDLIAQQRQGLPVFEARAALIEEIKANQATVIVGETGSGKTTQIPQFLYEEGFADEGMIGVTQPRRVAAMTVAQRVADEMGTPLGQKCGYTIRFDDKTSPSTLVKYMTDGMLLREVMIDSILSKYSFIILDEAHERTLHTDVLFSLLKGIQRKRPDMKLIVMSATLDAEKFAEYFNAKVIYIQGRQYPVEIMYTVEPEPDYADAALIATLQIHLDEPPGDILVFLTGQEQIEGMEDLLNEKTRLLPPSTDKLLVCPIFAALPPEQQMAVFSPTPVGCRKVVLATNIAETSITINGIRYVVDTGVVKARSFHPTTGVDSLLEMPVSKAQARQRTGRAGREAPGKCFRLYPERTFSLLTPTTVPEIKRTNLATVVLQLKALGIKNVQRLEFMDPPSPKSLVKALELLYSLGALDEKSNLTDAGKKMAAFPVDPRFGKCLLAADDLQCLSEVISIVSVLSSDSLFFAPKNKREEADRARNKFKSPEGDTMTSLKVLQSVQTMKGSREWANANYVNLRSVNKAMDVREQLIDHCKALKMDVGRPCLDTQKVRKALASGFFAQVAYRQPNGQYQTALDRQIVSIHPSSVMFSSRAKCVMYNELVFTSKYYIRDITAIDMKWLAEVAPHMYKMSN